MKFFAFAAALASVQAVRLQHHEYPTKDVGKLAGEVQPLQWCPDYDERHVLQDGHTEAIAWPERGFNCKTFHDVLGDNESAHNGTPKGWR